MQDDLSIETADFIVSLYRRRDGSLMGRIVKRRTGHTLLTDSLESASELASAIEQLAARAAARGLK